MFNKGNCKLRNSASLGQLANDVLCNALGVQPGGQDQLVGGSTLLNSIIVRKVLRSCPSGTIDPNVGNRLSRHVKLHALSLAEIKRLSPVCGDSRSRICGGICTSDVSTSSILPDNACAATH